MKIQFKKTPEQVELIQAMASKDSVKALEAQKAFAALIAPTIGEVLQQADTTSFLFREITFREDEDPSFPVSLYLSTTENHFNVTTSSTAGGLASNMMIEPTQEVKFNTFVVDAGISYDLKYARKARLDVVAAAIQRLMQEVLMKTQTNAWNVVMATLANARSGGAKQVFATDTTGVLTISDLNKILTKYRRQNTSWSGGSVVGQAIRPTDMILSPELMEQLRAMSYNPINTKGANNAASAAGDVVALTDAERARVFATGGTPEFFGVSLIEMLEFGLNQDYNVLFDTYDTGNINKLTTGTISFAAGTHDLALFVDASRDSFYKASVTDSEHGGTFSLSPDNQFVDRQKKMGWYGAVEVGYLGLDSRGLVGLAV